MICVDVFFYDVGGYLVEVCMYEMLEIMVVSNYVVCLVVVDWLIFCVCYDVQGWMMMVSGLSEVVSVQLGFQCSQVVLDMVVMIMYVYYFDGMLLLQFCILGFGQVDDDMVLQLLSVCG